MRVGAASQEQPMQTSARNQFAGEVTEVKHGAVNDEVTLRTQQGLAIVAVITHGSAASLGLAAGKKAFALIKASSVIVMVDVAKSQVSARNCIAGTVSAVTKGAVNSEVIISAGGAQIAAIITNESVDRLGLASGKAATAIFKASSVIVGVDA
jgi:molybdate transport system regulatory protein